jgi:hypothetical protein
VGDRVLRLVAALGLLASPLGAQAPAQDGDALLERLVGDWRMVGQVRGEPATYALTARRTLQGRFVELHMVDVSTPPQYEARVFVGVDSAGRVVAHWMDSFGAAFSIPHGEGRIAGDTVRFEIPYADGPFRDTFILDRRTGRWRFVLEAGDGKGGWSLFAEYDVRRAR